MSTTFAQSVYSAYALLAEGRTDNDRDVACLRNAEQLLSDIEAGRARELMVKEDHVGAFALGEFDPVFCIRCHHDAMTGGCQCAVDQSADGRTVVNDEDGGCHEV